ncbi:HTH_Tnp_Tc3_2 domain-containing protein [Trichonephila clavipes]|nr:HTH_Tnp_Tc3_2 domain-containing protein [Trichonephila clavipes]
MGHIIFEVAMKFGFSRTTFSGVYREYREADFNAGPSTSVTVQPFNEIVMGFRSKMLTCVSLLTARHKVLRLAWARQHRHWTVDDWKHVSWSDESRFQLNREDERVQVRIQPQESMDSTCQQGNVQAGGGFVMV